MNKSAWKCAAEYFSARYPSLIKLGSGPDQQLVTEHAPLQNGRLYLES